MIFTHVNIFLFSLMFYNCPITHLSKSKCSYFTTTVYQVEKQNNKQHRKSRIGNSSWARRLITGVYTLPGTPMFPILPGTPRGPGSPGFPVLPGSPLGPWEQINSYMPCIVLGHSRCSITICCLHEWMNAPRAAKLAGLNTSLVTF